MAEKRMSPELDPPSSRLLLNCRSMMKEPVEARVTEWSKSGKWVHLYYVGVGVYIWRRASKMMVLERLPSPTPHTLH